MATTKGRYTLALQVEVKESRNQSRILKTEVLDTFGSEAEALAEFKALLRDILDDDDGDDD